MTLQEELDELIEIRGIIEHPLFQKKIVNPLRDYQASVKSDFFADSLKESWRKGGQLEGSEQFFQILKQLNSDFINKKHELDIAEGK
jgi:hypothetical protein